MFSVSVLVDSWDCAMIGICASSLPPPPGVSVATCMAILHVGSAQQVRTGSTSSKEEDYESDAATIVQKCVSRVAWPRGPLSFSEEIVPGPLFPGRGKDVESSPSLPLGSRSKRWAFTWLALWKAPCLRGGSGPCER